MISRTTPVDIDLKYLIVHNEENLSDLIENSFSSLASVQYDIDDISEIINFSVIDINNTDKSQSLLEIKVYNMPYEYIILFERSIYGMDEIIEIYKTHDSYKLKENQEFLAELHIIEMKIREIYTILANLGNVKLENSQVKPLKDFQNDSDEIKRALMNEFFYINFSDYKNVDKKRVTKLEDLLEALEQVEVIEDISDVVSDLSYPSLKLEELFNELSRIPGAIGRLETFRNSIAHNRYISITQVQNFRDAKDIIDLVYENFISELRSGNFNE